MTNKVSPEEIARVEYIHGELDTFAENVALQRPGGLHLQLAINWEGQTLLYSEQEGREWPSAKAKMIADLRMYTQQTVLAAAMLSGLGSTASLMNTNDLEHWGDSDSIARGFVMYREQLEAKHPATYDPELNWKTVRLPTSTGYDKVISDCERAISKSIIGQQDNRDPYTGNDLAVDQELRMSTDYIDTTRKANEPTRRERLIAALAAELRKPVTARYPNEARSERALWRTNGGR